MKFAYRIFHLICGALLFLVELAKLINPLVLYCGYTALLEVAHFSQNLSWRLSSIKNTLLLAGVFLLALACVILTSKLCRKQPSWGISIASFACSMVFWGLYAHFWKLSRMADEWSKWWFSIHLILSLVLGITHLVLTVISHIKENSLQK